MISQRKPVKFAYPFQLPRYLSPRVAADTARTLEASGVVDDMMIYDYLISFNARSLWTSDITPIAETYKDDDSYHDAFVLSAIAMAASNLGVCIMTDSMRRGPWLSQTFFSLADTTAGQVTLAMGAGEARHGKPFGYERKEGLGRLKELMKIWNLMLDSDRPFDFDGKYWKLQQTYLGSIKPKRRPKLWALGGGPKLIEAAAKDADGFLTHIPASWATPEKCRAAITSIKEAVERNGRDPESFEFGVSAGVVIEDDPAQVDKILSHPLVKFQAAIVGRFSMAEWVSEGHQPPFPTDWHYANDLFPASISREECDRAIGRMTREMMLKSNFVGSARQVAAKLQEYVDAGVDWVVPLDISSLVNSDSIDCMERVLDVARILKGRK